MLTELTKTKSQSLSFEITSLQRELVTRGIHLRIGKNIRDLVSHIEGSNKRGPVHEQFDPTGDMDGAVDAFWICGFDPDGNLVHTQAAHLLDLNGSNFAQHIQSRISNFFPKSPKLVKSSVRPRFGPRARSISGFTAYHGEMWLNDRYRDKTTAALVIRLGILLIVREWNPDNVVGLMSWSLALRGFNMRIGYLHCEPATLAWNKQEDGSQHQVWLVYLERDDIAFLRSLPMVELLSAFSREFTLEPR